MTRRRDRLMPAIPLPSAKRLRQLLRYDPESGLMYWRARKGRARAGEVAGCVLASGRRQLRIDGVLYLASRVAWKIYTRREPLGVIDHFDRDNGNDSFWNLRDLSQRENMSNQKLSVRNTSGYRGVTRLKSGRWLARIEGNGKTIYLGTFKDLEKAAEACLMGSLMYQPHRLFRFGGGLDL